MKTIIVFKKSDGSKRMMEWEMDKDYEGNYNTYLWSEGDFRVIVIDNYSGIELIMNRKKMWNGINIYLKNGDVVYKEFEE